MILDSIILEAALLGLEEQKKRIDEQIEIVRSQLGRKGPGRPKAKSVGTLAKTQKTKARTISAAGRKRIADAQKIRWAAARKSVEESKKAVSKPVEKKKAASVKKVAATKKIAPPAKKNTAAATKKGAA